MTKRRGSRYKRGGHKRARNARRLGATSIHETSTSREEGCRVRRIMEIISRVERRNISPLFCFRNDFSSPPFFLLLFITFLDYNEMKKSAAAVDPFWKDLAEDGFVSRHLSNGRKVGRKVENKSGDSSGWVTRSTGRALNEITRAHGARLGNWIFVQSRRVPCLETRFSSGHPANFISEPAYRLNFSPARENP